MQFRRLRPWPLFTCLLSASLQFSCAMAQQAPEAEDESTVVYAASYFAQWEPFTVGDMLDRIPGITVARENGSGGSGSSNRRGLGLGGEQILINGRRITGKENEGGSQLSRIPANQVDRIEIIRGTSGDLDVRGGTQVINIVLLDVESRSSLAFEASMDQYHDGELKSGAKMSLSGQRGNFDYLLSASTTPQWEYRILHETSVLTDNTLNESIRRAPTTDAQPLEVSSNLGYRFNASDLIHLNAQYQQTDAPQLIERATTGYQVTPSTHKLDFDNISSDADFWEIGGDYEHGFANGNRWKTLFIINRKQDQRLRNRFQVAATGDVNDLFLNTFNRYQERIARSSYSMKLTASQDLEFGLEGAQSILDSTLRLGVFTTMGPVSGDFGGLTPVTNTAASVEETRYEAFAVHNWQINNRMSLESTLIFEESQIAQSGDLSKKRDFDFVRPKLDYRFDITPSLQFRATVEKAISQLSFNDFTANSNEMDDDQNAVVGNPDIRQEQSWRYDVNLEYRFNNDSGVINTNLFYHDLDDVIDKIDVSTANTLQSANGNIGDGTRYGGSIDASLRLGMFDLPQILLTSRVNAQDSEVTDPFLGIDRRVPRSGRGGYRLGFRHDMNSRNINYGFDFNGTFTGGRKTYDIDKIEDFHTEDFIVAYMEVQGWGELTYRFEAANLNESERCRLRTRYVGGTLLTGTANEIEDACSHAGEKYTIRIRGTF